MDPLSILVQVIAENTEGSKHGVSPDESLELVKHINTNCPFLKFCGVMSMGAVGNVEEFKAINELRNKMVDQF